MRPPNDRARDLCLDLGSAFHGMPEPEASVFWLVVRARRSRLPSGIRPHEAVAEMLGITVYAARKALSRARSYAEPRLVEKGLIDP